MQRMRVSRRLANLAPARVNDSDDDNSVTYVSSINNNQLLMHKELEVFIQLHHLDSVLSLEELGHIDRTVPNGNCGIETFILACWHNGLLPPIAQRSGELWTQEERQEDKSQWQSDIFSMREQLSTQFRIHWRKFRGDKRFHRASETADGFPLACYQRCSTEKSLRLIVWHTG